MCFHSKQSKSAQELKVRFKANFPKEDTYKPGVFNGFQHPQTPVITQANPSSIELFSWGLLPAWAKDESFQKNTLNARIETIQEKPSFRNVTHNHCLVLVDGFYEWQWLDAQGKHKQKYLLHLPNNEAFALAGLWSNWVDKNTGEIRHTYTILTTEASGLMREIHNSTLRMPIILNENSEHDWLAGKTYQTGYENLVASPI
jgi:putative SOS response-associated peptidase YedK